uniref:TLC domain-containing protein n=1 Tax=Meloidogyne hapla TaxID=6305 RepID=A0A1I8BIA6_MELHA
MFNLAMFRLLTNLLLNIILITHKLVRQWRILVKKAGHSSA